MPRTSSCYLSNVVRPDDDRADLRGDRVAPVSPITGEVITGTRIDRDQSTTSIPAAPSSRATVRRAIMMMLSIVSVVRECWCRQYREGKN